MIKVVKGFIIAILVAGLIYICGVFVANTFDTTQWEGIGKFIALVIWAIGTGCIIIALNEEGLL